MRLKTVGLPGAPALPPYSRQITQLMAGTELRMVSDLLPIHAITTSSPANGTQFQNIDWTLEAVDDPFKTYVLFNIEREDKWFARLSFIEARADQLTKPVLSQSSQMQCEWEPILNWVQIIKNTVTGDFFHRYAMVPGQNAMTDVLIEDYISTTPWTEDFPNERAISGEVSWYYQGTPMRIGRCLHKRLELPGFAIGVELVAQTGSGNIPSIGSPQIFEATNTTTWDVFTETTTKEDGSLFYRRSITYFPLDLPRAVTSI